MFDLNALVSRLLVPGSVPAQTVRKAIDEADLLVSEVTLYEFADVLARPKFDPYITIEDRKELAGHVVVYCVHDNGHASSKNH